MQEVISMNKECHFGGNAAMQEGDNEDNYIMESIKVVGLLVYQFYYREFRVLCV